MKAWPEVSELDPDQLCGEFIVTVEKRSRLRLPPRFANALRVGTSEKTDCLLAREREGVLSLWSKDSYDRFWEPANSQIVKAIEEQILISHFADVQAFLRLRAVRSEEISVGKDARFTIPEVHRDFLGLREKDQCVVVGLGFWIEVWNRQQWEEHLKTCTASYGAVFSKLLSAINS